ncbi:MAG: adenylosuccinate lyase [FCB group bacterium]|nr:adenylosuccinate lyase [FCB group bacterium]
MIDRYTTPELKRIWSEEHKFETWKTVELTVTDVLADRGEVPASAARIIREKADFRIDRILEIEDTTHHDVIAFLTCMAEYIGPESRYLHKGMTSSDLLDTSLALLCREAGVVILEKLKVFHGILRAQAQKYKMTFQIGRTHGVHAELITFGLKLALWSEEIRRQIGRWEEAVESISTGKISGAVGTYQHLDPDVELETCRRLGLKPAAVSSQIVPRDHHAQYLNALALIGATLEKIALEIRHLQRTEVLEVEEYFARGQKGSSAMPHKRNPIISERIAGLVRLLRGNALAGMENVALWHERDISHSSVERIIIPDSTTILDYLLVKIIALVKNLMVYPDKMAKNIRLTHGLIFSQEILLALIGEGMTREAAYQLVQKHALKAWENGLDFKKLLLEDPDVTSLLDPGEIDRLFDQQKVLINIHKIFDRLGL